MNFKRKKDLARLAFMMNRNTKAPIPVPALLPEIIACFDAIIRDDELDFLLRLGNKHHTYEDMRRLSGKVESVFKPFFERIAAHQLVEHYTYTDGQPDHYELNSILVGWFEGAMKSTQPMTPERIEFAKRMRKFFTKLEKLNFTPLRQIINLKMKFDPSWRTIVAIDAPTATAAGAKKSLNLNQKVETPGAVGGIMTPDKVSYYLDKFDDPDTIALCDCFCRKVFEVNEDPCRYDIPLESCIMLGSRARHIVDAGMGRAISKAECSKIIMDCYAKGAMLNVLYEHSDSNAVEAAICLCCPDCCGSIGSYNRSWLPLSVKAFYQAQANIDNCVGCKLCVKFCPTAAITLAEGAKKIEFDPAKCIGCGQCAFHCKKDVFTMVAGERMVYLPNRPVSEARFK